MSVIDFLATVFGKLSSTYDLYGCILKYNGSSDIGPTAREMEFYSLWVDFAAGSPLSNLSEVRLQFGEMRGLNRSHVADDVRRQLKLADIGSCGASAIVPRLVIEVTSQPEGEFWGYTTILELREYIFVQRNGRLQGAIATTWYGTKSGCTEKKDRRQIASAEIAALLDEFIEEARKGPEAWRETMSQMNQVLDDVGPDHLGSGNA